MQSLYILGGSNLTGDINNILTNEHLKVLEFRNTPNFSLSMKDLSRMDSLERLCLKGINFSGSIIEIAKISALKHLELGDYNTTDEIGNIDELLRAADLTSLTLMGDNIICDISCLEHMASLEYINIYHTSRVTGDISSLSQLGNLKYIRISVCNGITGDISEIIRLKYLNYLEISCYKGIYGDISNFADNYILRYLYLSGEGFCGDIAALSSLRNLEVLCLYNSSGIYGKTSSLKSLSKLEHYSDNINNITADYDLPYSSHLSSYD